MCQFQEVIAQTTFLQRKCFSLFPSLSPHPLLLFPLSQMWNNLQEQVLFLKKTSEPDRTSEYRIKTTWYWQGPPLTYFTYILFAIPHQKLGKKDWFIFNPHPQPFFIYFFIHHFVVCYTIFIGTKRFGRFSGHKITEFVWGCLYQNYIHMTIFI